MEEDEEGKDCVGRAPFGQAATPKLLDVHPLNGSFGSNVSVVLEGPLNGDRLRVFFGDVQCPVSSWRVEAGDYELSQGDVFGLEGLNLTQTVLEVPVCEFPATEVSVHVFVDPEGYALHGSPYLGADFQFEHQLLLFSVSPMNGSLYGGVELTILGSGFSSVPSENFVTVGSRVCPVSAASFGELRCWSPAAPEGAAGAQEVRVVVGPSGTGAGLSADYYLFGSAVSIADFGAYSPDSSGTTSTLNFESDPGTELGLGTSYYFGAVWRGYLVIATPGAYLFSLVSDDGSALWVDDVLVVNNQGFHAALEVMGTVSYLEEGDHYIEVKYQQGLGSSNLVFSYSGPDTGEVTVTVPEAALKQLPSVAGPSLQFEYMSSGSSPQAVAAAVVSSASEVELVINGSGFGSAPGAVALGSHRDPTANVQCTSASWSDAQVRCIAQDVPAGLWSVRLWQPAAGWSSAAPELLDLAPNVSEVEVRGTVLPAHEGGTLRAGLRGGIELTLRGEHLGLDLGQTEVLVCGRPCRVLEARNSSSLRCETPERRSAELADLYPAAFPAEDLAPHASVFYTDQGSGNEDEVALANSTFTSSVDHEINFYYDLGWHNREECWFAFELPPSQVARLQTVSIFPPTDPNQRERRPQRQICTQSS
ncbi:unnamed protein product [Prorocentrum cordatum]|uniref:PA14 domain-containing protein n=1 Tax=Prorocentrum cordatum TaxID=2364126 RepID=A0ABN9PHY4_9DINO|nr:unnamed protein product [Polarella glacialis]